MAGIESWLLLGEGWLISASHGPPSAGQPKPVAMTPSGSLKVQAGSAQHLEASLGVPHSITSTFYFAEQA